MASKEINLMPDKMRLSADEERRRRLIKRMSVATLSVLALTLLVVFGAALFLRQQLAATEAGIERERSRIKAMEKNEGAYMLLKQKSAALKNILASRFNFTEVFSFFREMESYGGKIQSITLTEAGEVTVTVVVPDSGALDSYIGKLLAVAEARFGRIEMQGVQFNPTGKFTVMFAVNVKGGEGA